MEYPFSYSNHEKALCVLRWNLYKSRSNVRMVVDWIENGIACNSEYMTSFLSELGCHCSGSLLFQWFCEVWNPESGSFCATGRNWKYTRRFLCGLLATCAGSLDPCGMGLLSLSVDKWRHISAKPSCFDLHREGALSHSNHTFACAHKLILNLQCRQCMNAKGNRFLP